MPVFYVRSTDGDNGDNGSTWALAKATLAGAFAIASAGDTIWVSHVHDETFDSDLTLSCPGTIASPCFVLCVNDGAEPPTALATTAVIRATSTYNLTIDGSAYYYGITLRCGIGASSRSLVIGSATALVYNVFEDCNLENMSTGSSPRIFVAFSGGTRERSCTWINTNAKFNATGGCIQVMQRFDWKGGAYVDGAAVSTRLFLTTASTIGQVHVSGVDLSTLNTNLVLPDTLSSMNSYWFRNCKLHADVTVIEGPILGPGGEQVFVDNCGSGDTNYKIDHRKYQGSIIEEVTIKRTGGASDGTTGFCWEMVTLATPHFHSPLESPPISIWNEDVGSPITLTVEIVHDSLTKLQDDEIWVEVEYLGTSGFPLSLFASDRMADILATPADQPASSETWTTTGLTNPNKQYLSVTFTPQEKGLITARVMVAKASYTVYVCPKVAIT